MTLVFFNLLCQIFKNLYHILLCIILLCYDDCRISLRHVCVLYTASAKYVCQFNNIYSSTTFILTAISFQISSNWIARNVRIFGHGLRRIYLCCGLISVFSKSSPSSWYLSASGCQTVSKSHCSRNCTKMYFTCGWNKTSENKVRFFLIEFKWLSETVGVEGWEMVFFVLSKHQEREKWLSSLVAKCNLSELFLVGCHFTCSYICEVTHVRRCIGLLYMLTEYKEICARY